VINWQLVCRCSVSLCAAGEAQKKNELLKLAVLLQRPKKKIKKKDTMTSRIFLARIFWRRPRAGADQIT
jgi:hypothetical protein